MSISFRGGSLVRFAGFYTRSSAPLAVALNALIAVEVLGGVLYGAGWLMFVGGITDALNMLRSVELLSSGGVAIAVIKIFGAGPVASDLVFGGIALAFAILGIG